MPPNFLNDDQAYGAALDMYRARTVFAAGQNQDISAPWAARADALNVEAFTPVVGGNPMRRVIRRFNEDAGALTPEAQNAETVFLSGALVREVRELGRHDVAKPLHTGRRLGATPPLLTTICQSWKDAGAYDAMLAYFLTYGDAAFQAKFPELLKCFSADFLLFAAEVEASPSERKATEEWAEKNGGLTWLDRVDVIRAQQGLTGTVKTSMGLALFTHAAYARWTDDTVTDVIRAARKVNWDGGTWMYEWARVAPSSSGIAPSVPWYASPGKLAAGAVAAIGLVWWYTHKRRK